MDNKKVLEKQKELLGLIEILAVRDKEKNKNTFLNIRGNSSLYKEG